MNKFQFTKKLGQIVILAAIFLIAVTVINAANYTVTRSDDRDSVCNSNVDCSLREAVKAAGSSAGDDVIDFSPNLMSVTLTNEIIFQVASGSILISGRGASNFTIDGGAGTNRIFTSIFASVTISGMTLTGGNGGSENRSGFGGAIYSDGGTMTLDRVYVTGNTTGSAGGGADFENGTYRILNSTFSSNTAFNCGGVDNGGAQLTIVNSTISGNTVSQQGGGLCANGNTTLRNDTIANNTASNASGILKAAGGTLNIGNTIVANNGASEIQFNGGAIVSAGNNMIGDAPGEAANTGQFMPVVYHPTDILDTSPMLASLQNNGGETPTHAFLTASPAIDGGNNSLAVDPASNLPLLTDQRGFDRLKDGNGDGSATVDIGAFEVRSIVVSNINDSGTGSLRQSLLDVILQGDSVIFSPVFFNSPQTIILTSGELAIAPNTKFSIVGNRADQIAISGNNQKRVFEIGSGAIVGLSRLTIRDGNSGTNSDGGGGILNRATLAVTEIVLINNKSEKGNAICNFSGTLTVSNSTITNNQSTSASGQGGGIYINSGTANVTNSSIVNNSTGSAGGVYNSQLGTINFNNSTISNNSSVSFSGGGIKNLGSLTLNNSSVNNNISDGSSGGIDHTFGTLTITNSNINNNSANGGGGGGLSHFNGGTITISNSTVSGNKALGSGGGVGGGGILIGSGSAVTITNSTISGNTTRGQGGGVAVFLGTFSATNSTISKNSAINSGQSSANSGAIENSKGTVNLTNATIAYNFASSTVGGIRKIDASGSVNAKNTIISSNSAGNQGNASDFSGTLNSLGYNLLGTSSGATITGVLTGNQLNVNPLLDPVLRNNGGGTQTHALRFGSPAIDKGSFGVNTDQRSSFRPYDDPAVPNALGGNGSDIGAFERQLADQQHAVPQFDYDGDGRSDTSVFRPSNNVWYLNQTTNGFFAVSWGSATDKLVPADYDGDGKTDLAVYQLATGTWTIRRSSDLQVYSVSFGAAEDIPVPADFDGDGKADISVYRPSNGVWYRLNSLNNQFVANGWGANGDKPVIGDFDGDGKSDLAVYRPSNGVWYIVNSSNLQYTIVGFGAAEDLIVPGDYDGDGKTDIAVYRPSNNVWYRLNSSNGAFAAVGWGAAGDKPVPADYDGDGRTDIAVYRNGTWYIVRSSDGQIGYDYFGNDTDIPLPNVYVR